MLVVLQREVFDHYDLLYPTVELLQSPPAQSRVEPAAWMFCLEVQRLDCVGSGGLYDLLAEGRRNALASGGWLHIYAAQPVGAPTSHRVTNLGFQSRNAERTALSFRDQVKRKGIRTQPFEFLHILLEGGVAR